MQLLTSQRSKAEEVGLPQSIGIKSVLLFPSFEWLYLVLGYQKKTGILRVYHPNLPCLTVSLPELSEMVLEVVLQSPRPARALRSPGEALLEVPSIKEARLASTRSGAFSVAAPLLWNSFH